MKTLLTLWSLGPFHIVYHQQTLYKNVGWGNECFIIGWCETLTCAWQGQRGGGRRHGEAVRGPQRKGHQSRSANECRRMPRVAWKDAAYSCPCPNQLGRPSEWANSADATGWLEIYGGYPLNLAPLDEGATGYLLIFSKTILLCIYLFKPFSDLSDSLEEHKNWRNISLIGTSWPCHRALTFVSGWLNLRINPH